MWDVLLGAAQTNRRDETSKYTTYLMATKITADEPKLCFETRFTSRRDESPLTPTKQKNV